MMDGIKKIPTRIPEPAPEPRKQEPEAVAEPEEILPPPLPQFQKREELYIPKEETMLARKHEELFQRGKFIRRIIWVVLIALATVLVAYAIFFSLKARSSFKKMNPNAAQTTLTQDIKSLVSPIIPSADKQTLKGANDGRINILLLGAAGEKKPGGNLTDTIMVMSIDTKNKKVAMLSLPRDFFVQIPNSTSSAKINSLYKIGISQQKGADLIKEAVEKITDLKINYFFAVDFDAFQKIIDDIGGVNVIAERDIYDATYPGPNYSYETFSLTKGPHLLDGATALKFVRERHDDPEGDFGRAKRQQQVIQAVKNRMFSMQTLFNVVALNNILNTLSENIKTDMSFDDIDQFIKLSRTVDTQNINNVVVDAWKPDSLLKVSHVMIGNDRAFILVPRIGNYSEIKDLAKNIFDQTELKKRKEMIANENAKIAIINQSSDNQLASKIKKLLVEKLNMKSVRIVSSDSGNTSQTTTITTDQNSAKIFTLDELIKKIPATLTPQETSSEDNITITLGNDIIDAYKYEEDTMQDLQNADDKEIGLITTSENN